MRPILLALGLMGCAQVITAMAVDGSDQGARGRTEKFHQMQKAEAFWRNKKLLNDTQATTVCEPQRKAEFEAVFARFRLANEHLLEAEVSLAEANDWSDTLRDRVVKEVKACQTPVPVTPPDAGTPFQPFVSRPTTAPPLARDPFDVSAPNPYVDAGVEVPKPP